MSATKIKRTQPRKVFKKTVQAIFDHTPQITVVTRDLSMGGVGIVSPSHSTPNSTCWIRLRLPETPNKELVFDVKTVVTYSVFSNTENGFKLGLKFVNANADMLALVEKIINK